MTREHWAVLIGGLIAIILRLGDVLLKWVAHKLGVHEDGSPTKRRKKPEPKE